jgi:hypothetical protein
MPTIVQLLTETLMPTVVQLLTETLMPTVVQLLTEIAQLLAETMMRPLFSC